MVLVLELSHLPQLGSSSRTVLSGSNRFFVTKFGHKQCLGQWLQQQQPNPTFSFSPCSTHHHASTTTTNDDNDAPGMLFSPSHFTN
jgi:hypothetical protein